MSMKKSWKTRKPAVVEPKRPSWEEARAVMRQVVMESAPGIRTSAFPSESDLAETLGARSENLGLH